MIENNPNVNTYVDVVRNLFVYFYVKAIEYRYTIMNDVYRVHVLAAARFTAIKLQQRNYITGRSCDVKL